MNEVEITRGMRVLVGGIEGVVTGIVGNGPTRRTVIVETDEREVEQDAGDALPPLGRFPPPRPAHPRKFQHRGWAGHH